MNFKGTVKVNTISVGSKSDGRYCYLKCDDDSEYKLCRDGIVDMNDELLLAFEDKNVVINGEISGKWIVVDTIKELFNPEIYGIIQFGNKTYRIMSKEDFDNVVYTINEDFKSVL